MAFTFQLQFSGAILGVYASNHGELAEAFNEQVYGYGPWGKAHAHNAGYPGSMSGECRRSSLSI